MASGMYKLSATLLGHEDDVRAVLFPNPNLVISSSRDSSVRLWNRDGPNATTFTQSINSTGAGFINSLAWIEPSAEYKKGLVISGGQETIIEVREPLGEAKMEANYIMPGHAHNVCALDVLGDIIISGSWDCKARVWGRGKWETLKVLDGHKGSVWAVLALPNGVVLTGSADKTIGMWQAGKLVKVLKAHTDCVRGLCRLPNGGFASCGNDATVRIWSEEGDQLQELHGHTSFVYSVASLPNGDIVSSGEDRTVKIWRNGECIQTITHPAISVWAVAVCQETGDIVSGASDRNVRVFSRDPQRWADQATIKNFEDSVAASSIPAPQVGEINKEKLPTLEALNRPGNKDGQVIMVRNGDIVEAHIWSAASASWTNVGTVVDAAGSSQKKEYDGKMYDYVFDVDIQEGVPPLKLPYNASQNPYEAATKFLEKNKLPISYLDTVANFIVQNSKGTTIGQAAEPASADPYGTESRYRPGEESSSSKPKPKALPQREYLKITQANLSMIKKKLVEINEGLLAEGSKDLCINPDEVQGLEALIDCLETKQGPATMSQVTSDAMHTIARLLRIWSPAQRIPALDLLRLAAAASSMVTTYHPVDDPSVTIVDVLEGTGVFDKSQPNNVMLGTRAFVNMFQATKSREFVEENFEKIFKLVSTAAEGTGNKNLKVAVATLVLNYAILFNTKNYQEKAKSLLPYLTATLTNETDSETLFRALVALGTLFYLGGDLKKTAVRTFLIRKAVDLAVGRAHEARVTEMGAEITALI